VKQTLEYHLGIDGEPFRHVSSEEFIGAWVHLKKCGKDAAEFEGVRFLIVERIGSSKLSLRAGFSPRRQI